MLSFRPRRRCAISAVSTPFGSEVVTSRSCKSLLDVAPIQTPRLRLAPLLLESAEELRALTDDPRITSAISFLSAPFSLADAQCLIRDHSSDRERLYGIRDRKGMHLVGVIGAHLHDTKDVEIGYWIGTEFQGRRYAREAARAMVDVLAKAFPDRRIVAECKPSNAASWHVLETAGFTATGLEGRRSGRQLLVVPIRPE